MVGVQSVATVWVDILVILKVFFTGMKIPIRIASMTTIARIKIYGIISGIGR
jgi:hypothetical protein